MKTGISLYLGSGFQKNKEIIEKAKKANVTYAFTSLHIPEESISNYQQEVKQLLDMCKQNDIHLLVDVGPRTLEKLGYASFEELSKTSITHIRLDYGFTHQDMVNLSKNFHIVCNASTLLDSDIRELKKLGADFTKFSACHNFYPKPLTGLSIEKTKEINQKLNYLGMETIGFVSADKERRGPLFEGLPTVEEHRNMDVAYSMLELHFDGLCDICMVGDVDVEDTTWNKIQELSNHYISLRSEIIEGYDFIKDIIHHDRPDASAYVFRSQESREYGSQGRHILADPKLSNTRNKGSISIGNEKYLRYSGEVEIARLDLALEERVNIVGQVCEEDIKYIVYIRDGFGCKFV